MELLNKYVEGSVACDSEDTGNETVAFNPFLAQMKQNVKITVKTPKLFIYGHILIISRPGSSVGIATELRAGRSGIESRWGRDFPPVQTGPGVHPASCKMGTGSFPGVNAAGVCC